MMAARERRESEIKDLFLRLIFLVYCISSSKLQQIFCLLCIEVGGAQKNQGNRRRLCRQQY